MTTPAVIPPANATNVTRMLFVKISAAKPASSLAVKPRSCALRARLRDASVLAAARARRGARVVERPAGREEGRRERAGRRDREEQRPLGDEAPVPGRDELDGGEPPAGGRVHEVAGTRDEILEPRDDRVAGPASPREGEIGGRGAVELAQARTPSPPSRSGLPPRPADERVEPAPRLAAIAEKMIEGHGVQYEDRMTIETPEGVWSRCRWPGSARASSRPRSTSRSRSRSSSARRSSSSGSASARRRAAGCSRSSVVSSSTTSLFEVLRVRPDAGQAPGRLRVVRSGGEPVGFVTSAIRNILRRRSTSSRRSTSWASRRSSRRAEPAARRPRGGHGRCPRPSGEGRGAQRGGERTRRDCSLGFERDHRRRGRRRSPLPRAPARDRVPRRRTELARTFAMRLAPKVAGAQDGLERGALPDAARRREDGTWFFDALGSRAHFPVGRERGSADVRAVVPSPRAGAGRPGHALASGAASELC